MYKMRPGCIVEMKKQHWVLINTLRMSNKGNIEEKVFYLLPPKPNFVEETKPYTHKRAESLDSIDKKNLNEVEMSKYLELKKGHWQIRLN